MKAMERVRFAVFLALGAMLLYSRVAKIWLIFFVPNDLTSRFDPTGLMVLEFFVWLAPLVFLYLVRRNFLLLAAMAVPTVLTFFPATAYDATFDLRWGELSICLIVLWGLAHLAKPLFDSLDDRFSVSFPNMHWPAVRWTSGIAVLVSIGIVVVTVGTYRVSGPKRPASGKFDFLYFESLGEEDVLHDASIFVQQQFPIGTPVSEAVAAFKAAGAKCGRDYIPIGCDYSLPEGRFLVTIEWKIIITPRADGLTIQSISVNRGLTGP